MMYLDFEKKRFSQKFKKIQNPEENSHLRPLKSLLLLLLFVPVQLRIAPTPSHSPSIGLFIITVFVCLSSILAFVHLIWASLRFLRYISRALLSSSQKAAFPGGNISPASHRIGGTLPITMVKESPMGRPMVIAGEFSKDITAI